MKRYPNVWEHHNDPDLEAQVNGSSGLPHWLMPLTCLSDLDSYFQDSQVAAEDLLWIVVHHDWPRAGRDGGHATDAAWLLLQHADQENQTREDALAAVTQAVTLGHNDPSWPPREAPDVSTRRPASGFPARSPVAQRRCTCPAPHSTAMLASTWMPPAGWSASSTPALRRIAPTSNSGSRTSAALGSSLQSRMTRAPR